MPIERLPYYRQLWNRWHAGGSDVPWAVIRAACLYEREFESVPSLEEGLQRLKAEPDAWEAVTGTSRYFLKPTLPPELVKAWSDH